VVCFCCRRNKIPLLKMPFGASFFGLAKMEGQLFIQNEKHN